MVLTVSNLDASYIDELGLEVRLPVLEKHLDDLTQVPPKLTDVGALRMRTGPPRYIPDQHSG